MGPEQIVNYLGRYTHRVAISSSRLVSTCKQKIVFHTRGRKTCSLTPEEFIRRFLLHVLPRQFLKIRHYGLLAPGNVHTRLVRARELLGPVPAQTEPVDPVHTVPDRGTNESAEPATDPIEASNERNAVNRTAPRCPHCGGRLAPLIARTFHRLQRAPPD